jgi:uncharacterized protein (AIM24 family)
MPGTGALAVTAFGTPVVLQVDEPTYVDMQSAVLWPTSLNSSVRRTVRIVAVQASEGHPPPPQQ